MEFMQKGWFMGLMAVLAVALIGLFFYMRKQTPDD